MKKLISFFGLILMTILVLISINSLSGNESNINDAERNNSASTLTSNPDEFIVGAYNIGCTDLNRLQELGLNMWHRFLAQHDQIVPGMNQTRFPMGFTTNDSLFKSINSYQSEAVGYYNSVSQLNNNYLYLTRPKIEMLSFAQRSDYHPFALNLHQQSIKGKWWYGYNSVGKGVEVSDGDINVRKCTVGEGAGYVLSELRPTWEQVKGDIPNNFFNDGQYSWYIKPKVKIDKEIDDTIRVFRVDIHKKDGTLLNSTIIKRSDFGINYNEEYVDEFFPSTNNPLYIFNGADLKGTDPPDNSQVDYRIFWYGNCDMWIQHVRVENDWAYRLFNDYYLRPSDAWIKWEVQNIGEQIGSKAYKFLLDESEYNMYPAIGYLNQKINSFKSPGTKLSAIALHNIVMMTPEQKPLWTDTMRIEDIDTIFRKSGMNEVFTDVYPIYADSVNMRYYGKRQYVPNTLPESDYNIRDGRLGKPAEPFLYEKNLNENIDCIGHRYIEFNQNANYLSRKYNVPYVAAIQIHSWYNGLEHLYSLREPTNQEIEMLAGIALTYGAKGIIYHAYNSIDKTNAEHNQYSRGLVGDYNYSVPDDSMCNGGKRYRNAYKQNKWNFVCNLTSKLKNLGKTIINFKNTDSYGYRYHNLPERTSLINSSYIHKIVTFRDFGPISNCTEMNTPTNMIAECQDDTYLQIGTFKTAEPYERYLMVVNRRTSPDSLSAINGKRLLRIITKENSSDLAGFNNWKIIDVESNSDVAVFNKSELSSIDVGWINPGEIKLYKIAPVMQEGGTLECDENIENLSPFDCKDMVYGNGHNITIGQGVTINFADTAGIEMQNGNFLCGNDNTFGSTQVTLKPKVPSAGWNGVSVTNGGITYIYNTIFENPKSGKYSLTFANCSEIKVKYCTFNNNSDLNNNGGIMINVYNSNSEPVPSYISNNLFVMKGSNLPALNINSTAGSATNPVIVEYNTFNTITSSLEAISFTNVSGGEIRNNVIANYEKWLWEVPALISLED